MTIVDPLSDNFALVDNSQHDRLRAAGRVLVVGAMVVSALGSGVTLRRFLRI